MRSTTYSLVTCSILLGAAVLPAAAGKKAPSAPAPPPDMRKLVQSVDTAASSVVIVYMNGQQTKTYKIDDLTSVKVNGNTAKLADVKPGMVVADYVERDNDDLDTLTVTGFGGSTGSVKPATKAKPKPKPKPATTADSSS